MSYLDVPRLHFSGTFIANPSTINNTPTNYDPADTQPAPAWNPNGNHFWRFTNCTVKSVVFADGKVVNAPQQINATVASTDAPVPAKLVDLDTEQQFVSQIWGLQIKVSFSETDYFVGDFRVVPFDDITFARSKIGNPLSRASAFYQSFLDNVKWGPKITSPFLKQLQGCSPARLSVKFVVDGFDADSSSPTFTHGRVAGTVGPAWADEPPNFVLGRSLRVNAQLQPEDALNYGYARVDPIRKRLLVDLGNSIPTVRPGGPPPETIGKLQVVVGPSTGTPVVIGDYDYSETAYLNFAGIQEYALNPKQLAALTNTPLGVVQTDPQGARTVPLQEGANGTYICATQQVYRMDPSDVAAVELIALRFGQPATGETVTLGFNNNMFQPPQTPPPPDYSVGTPPSALSFPASVTTGDDGRVSFALTASDPGNPRTVIDGQIYGVGYTWAADNDPQFPADPWNFVSVRVFDSYEKAPTWANIQPILQQYAKLYPFMDSIFQLDDPNVIKQNIAAFKRVLNLPITDPRYMPVTRDMSRDKRQLILDWLNLGAPTT
jgi:hypothetical protein